MDKLLDQHVRNRAKNRCEYCHLPQSASRLKFPIDHIIALQHEGPTTAENLALCCGRCNQFKGPNISGIDPDTRRMTRLFHPRLDRWEDHFRFDQELLIPLSDVGRATVAVLQMNHPHRLSVRRALLDSGLADFQT